MNTVKPEIKTTTSHTIEHKLRFIVEVTVKEHTHLNDGTLGKVLVSDLARSSLIYHLSNTPRIRIIGEADNGD